MKSEVPHLGLRLLHSFFLLGISLIVFSCETYNVPLDPKVVRPSIVERRFPGRLLVYYPDQFSEYALTETTRRLLGTNQWEFKIGPASWSLFEQILPMIFRAVRRKRGVAKFPIVKRPIPDLVLVPLIEGFYWGFGATPFGDTFATIRYRLTIYDPKGKLVYRTLIKGESTVKGIGKEVIGDVANAALEDGGRKIIEDLLTSIELKLFLRKRR